MRMARFVRFQPNQVLKGTLKTDKLYTINYADEYNRVGLKQVMEKIAAYAEGKPAVLFLGYLHTDGETLVPDSLDKAVWPRNTAAPIVQTPDTLEECITFVRAVMANPEIKLKIVNGRRVLPDGYTLPAPPTAPKTGSKEKPKAAEPQVPPSTVPQANSKPSAAEQTAKIRQLSGWREPSLPVQLSGCGLSGVPSDAFRSAVIENLG